MITDKAFQVATWAVDRIGLKTFRGIELFLSETQLSWAEWWGGGGEVWTVSGLKPHQQMALRNFKSLFSPEAYFEVLSSKKIWTVSEKEETYPSLLLKTSERPPVLFGQGKKVFSERAVAVVGTRHITSYGRSVTEQIVKELVAEDVTIVSGFMFGVDVVAHTTAHSLGGKTIGVLGFGFDHMYPSQQRALFNKLVFEGQTFVTEYAPHVSPTKGTFVCRNRLLAGMSQATLVTEAGLKSGSHSTAKWAIEFGRSVCAVPGSITNPYSQGTKWLINQGAKLVDSADDIIEELGWKKTRATADAVHSETTPAFSADAQKVLAELQILSQSADQLATACHLPIAKILMILTTLELNSRVQKEGAKWSVC